MMLQLCKCCISVNSSHVSLDVQIEFVLIEMYVWFVLVNCVAHNWNLNENYFFLIQKQTLLNLIQSPECWKSPFRALKFRTFLREQAPRPPQRYGINGPLLIQSGILFKPAGYFNYYCFSYAKRCISVNSPHVSLHVQMEFVLGEMQVWLVLVNCVAHNWNLNENYSSLNQKQTLLYLIQSPECWKSHFRALKFQTSVREHGPRPPQRYGINGPLLIQSGILFKPAGYFNHY